MCELNEKKGGAEGTGGTNGRLTQEEADDEQSS